MVKRYHHKTVPGMAVEYEVVPNGIFVNWTDYDALQAELAAQIEDCTVNYNQRVILTNRVEQLEAALRQIYVLPFPTHISEAAKIARELLATAETACEHEWGQLECIKCGADRPIICRHPGCTAKYDYHHAHSTSDRQAGKFKCNACEDSGWLWGGGPNHRVPCDVCEAGPAWLNAQMTQADWPGAE